MKVSGREIKCAVLVNFIISMVIIMKEHSYRIRHTDKAVCSKSTDRDTRALGGKTTQAERGHISMKITQSMREILFKEKNTDLVE